MKKIKQRSEVFFSKILLQLLFSPTKIKYACHPSHINIATMSYSSDILPFTNQESERMKAGEPKRNGWCYGFWIILLIIVTLGSIGAALYFGLTSTQATTPCTETNNPPVTKSTTSDYKWLKDEPLLYSKFKFTNLYSGLVTHSKMLSICKPNSKNRLTIEEWKRYLSPDEAERDFDRNIRTNEGSIFESLPIENRLMWTGCFFEHNNKETNCKTEFPFTDENNFCNVQWEKELMELQTDSINVEQERIYIVKDYGKPNSCWQLYLPKQITSIMNQPSDSNPRLPFACLTNTSVDDSD